jgi:hypothetical protein
MEYSRRMRRHRWTRGRCRTFAGLAIAVMAVGFQPAAGAFASSSHQVSARTRATTTPDYPWKGHHPPCAVRLPTYGSINYKSFTTCPPKRVLLIGDSVALTMGIQMSLNQENWGALIENASLNQCGFVTGYSVEVNGTTTAMDPKCADEPMVWTKDAHRFKPDAIVVEMGWWDSLLHVINGTTASLSQPQYDTMVEHQVLGLIADLRSVSAAPIYLLSVPWMHPGPLPNGQQEPASTAAYHDKINSLIEAAAQTSKTVHFVDISSYITPSGHYQRDVDRGNCRASDGIELYYSSPGALHYVQTLCGKALQRGVLSVIRQALANGSHP